MTAPDSPLSERITMEIGWDTVIGSETEHDADGDFIGYRPVTLGDRVAEILAERVQRQNPGRDWYANVARTATETAERLVEEKFREVLQREIIPTDPYGNAKGEPQTLAELITKRAEAWLSEPETRDGYGHKRTHFQQLIDTEVGRAWKTEVGKAIEHAKAKVQAEISQQAAQVFAEVIQRAATR